MQNALGGSGRGAVVTGMLLAAFALAGCESAENQEIGALIEEIGALQEQRIAVMETTAEEEIADDREHDAGKVEQTERQWEERLQAARGAHARTLTKLRETLASGEWEAAYPLDMALLNGSALAVVAGMRAAVAERLSTEEEQAELSARMRTRRAEIRRTRQERSDAMRRLPDPSAWSTGGTPSDGEVLGRNGPER